MARPDRRRAKVRSSLARMRSRLAGSPASRPTVAIERLESRQLLAVLHWDPDQIPGNNVVASGAGLGGPGTWSEGGAAAWFDPSLNGGTGGYVSWNSARGDTAVFAGPAGGTVAISGSVSAAGVEFRGSGYTVSGGGFTTLSSGTTFTATVAGRFDTPIAGSGGISKTGVATLTLGAVVNSYTGDTVVSAGLLDVRGTIRSHVRPNGGSVQGVMFYDPDMATAVREALGVDADAWLTTAVLAQSPPITSLTVNGLAVGDLTGVANLTALTSLELIPGDYAGTPQGIDSLAPLAGLTSLTALSLHDVGLTNALLETLPALPALTTLDVRYNALSSVPASVANLPRLATIFVHGNPLITDDPRAGLASLKGRAVDVDVAPDRPETATSIADLAARLYFLPLKMLEYVTNTVAFQPYSGAMKGPLATLQTKAGNDWDTNSLLASLYGAAGISTRYVAGTIEVTTQQLMDYVGTRDVAAAAKILQAAGLADDTYANRLKHTWLEALVTVPTSGAQSWVPLDASWKVRDYRPGLPGMLTTVPFNPLEQGYLTEPAWQKRSTAEYYEAKVAAWLAQPQNRPDLTIADVGYDGPIRQQAFSALPAGLPYGVDWQPPETETARPSEIPVDARYAVTVTLGHTGVLPPESTLMPGDSLFSPNGQFRLVMQPQGNLVLYRETTALWATPPQTLNFPGSVFKVQQDGNLALFVNGATLVWSSGTFDNPNSRLVLQNDGNLVLYSAANTLVWQTGTVTVGTAGLPPAPLFSTTLNLDTVALSRIVVDPGLNAAGSAVTPALLFDGIAAARAATSVTAATQLTLTVSVTAPAGGMSYSRTFTRAADRMIAIGLDANQFSEPLLAAKRGIANVQQLNRANGVAVDRDQAVGGLLDLAISQYFATADADEASLAALTSAIPDRTKVALGIATSAASLSTSATASLQFPYLPADMGIDVPANVNGGFAIDASTTALDLNRNLLLGYTNSALEGLVLEELTNFESVSTMKAFQLAATSAGGLSNLVEINADNVSSIATLLPGVRADIRNAIAATVTTGLSGVADYAGVRFSAVVPRNEITVGGSDPTKQWKGVGYTLKCVTPDPASPLNGVTVGFIIHGSVAGGPLLSYGGATSKLQQTLSSYKPSAPVSNPDNGAGDPVNVVTGNVYHEETDFELPNVGSPLAFRRRYDSVHTESGLAGARAVWSDRGMGEGWSFTYSDRLEPEVDGANTVTWFTDSGTRLVFTKWQVPMLAPARGDYVTPAGVFGGLTGSAASGFTWTDFDGNTTTFGPAVSGFCSIASKSDRFGNGVKVDYIAGTTRLSRVSDLRDASRFIAFSYNADSQPHIWAVTDFTGRVWNYAYSGARLTTVTAPAPSAGATAPVVRYAYHPDAARLGLLESVVDPSGFKTSWEYYANRRGFRVTDAENLTHSFTYNLHRRQSAFIDERGNAVRYSYDGQGNLLEIQQPDRTTARSSWSTNGLKLSATDAYGATVGFTYDMGTGKVTSVTDAIENFTTTTYTSGTFSDIDTITRFNRPNDASDDVVTKFTYDASGFLTSKIEDVGAGKLNATTRYEPTPNTRKLTRSVTTPEGRTTYLAYNSGGQVTRRFDTTRSGGLIGEYYDNPDFTGLVGTRTDATVNFAWGAGAPLPAMGNDTFSVRWIGQIIPVVTGVHTLTSLSDDGIRVWVNGQLLIDNWTDHAPTENSGTISLEAGRRYDIRIEYYENALGATLSLFWAAPGLSRQIIPAERLFARVPIESFAYDARGNLLTQADANGNTTTFAYDTLGRTISETSADPDGTGDLPSIAATFAYDVSGNLGSTTRHDGRVNRTGFDRRQRPVRVTAMDGTYTLVSYDPVGNKASETDALGRITRYVYDARNRLVATLLPDGTTTRSRHDGGGRTVATLDQAGGTTTYAYDKLGRKIRETLPDPDGTGPLAAPTTAWGYDSRGNVQFVTASFVGQSGVVAGDAAWSTHYEYDNLGRRTKETQADPDGSGPLARPVTVFSYDLDGNLLAVTDPRGFTTSFTYDSLGRKTTETSPDPDGTGPLVPLVKQFVYDAAGNLRFEIAPGGTSQADVSFTTEHVYDALNRRIRTILPDPDGPTGPLARPVTSQSFDSSGRLSTTTDALGRVTTSTYRSSDRVLRITAPDGSFMNRIYDAVGNMVFTVEAVSSESHGRRTFTTFDALNRPIAVRDPRPDATSATPVTTYVYDVTGNLIRSTDELGRTTWRQYDALGRLTAETSPLGLFAGDPQATTRTEYDAAGRVTSTIDELGRRTDTVYDSLGRKIREIAPDAGLGRPTTHYAYDAAGNLRFTTDPRGAAAGDTGFTTYFFYDALGRRTATVDALGPDWPHTALPDTLPGTVTTNVTRIVYDARGRIASTTDALGQTTDYGYDNLGRRISETAADPDGAGPLARPVTRFTYDAVGNLRSTTTPLGASAGDTGFTTYFFYDALNRKTATVDPRGADWSVTAIPDSLSATVTAYVTRTTYDLTGNTTSVTDASGNVTRYAFDRLNRLVTETDPLGAVTTSAYDLVGNKTRETDRLGRVTWFTFDAADRLVEERWQASASAAVFHTITRFYDGSDQLLGVTEADTTNPAATTAWQFAYDALGQLVKSRMAPGEIVQTPALDAVPSPPGTLAAGDATGDWDLDGRLERYDGYPITLAVGDQLLLTASSTAFDPVLILQKPTGGLATAFFDDASGGGTTARLLVTADVAGTWTVVVTSRDELASGAYDLKIVKDQNAIVPAALVEYDFTYDKAGNLLTTTEDQAAVAQFGALGPAASGLGIRTAYTIDALNRVTRYRHIDVATGAVLKRTDYAYRPEGSVGTVTRFAGAGINPVGTSTAAYDSMGRLTGITHAPSASPSIAYNYAYDAASRMTALTTPEGTSSFTLDATDQLLSASLTGEAYAYDKTGNRTSGGTQTGTGNRLLSDGTYRYAYDAEGNRTAKFVDTNAGGTLSLGDTDVTVYAYDQRNRLVAVSHVTAWTATQAAGLAAFNATGTPLPGSDLELRYTYDYADRRIRKSLDADGQAGAGQEAVSFAAYAGDVRTLEIARPNDKLVIDSLRGPIGFLGQVVQRTFYGNGVDEILAVDRVTWNGTTPTTSTFWTFTDHQDSVRDIVSGTGATLGQVVEHRQYDSFGKVVRRTIGPQAGAATTAGVGVEFAYAGRPFEARTGLSDNRARWYEPATGRFVNEDPSGFKGGDANLFRYVGNDPLNQVDPSGLAAKWASGAKASVPAAGWAALGGTGQPAVSDPRPTVAIASRAGWSMQNQTYPTFTGRPDRGIPFGEFILTRGTSAEPALPTSGFGARDAASLGVDFAPWPIVGSAKSAVELVAGYDYIAAKPTSRALAAVGVVAGVLPFGKGLLKGAAKTIGAIGRTADDAVDVARVVTRVDDGVGALRRNGTQTAATAVSEHGGLNLYRRSSAESLAESGWREGDRFLYLPNQGTPKANWTQNAGRLRQEMRQGHPIFDSYRDPVNGLQIPAGIRPSDPGRFLNAERQLLESHGWRYNPMTGAYHPPGK